MADIKYVRSVSDDFCVTVEQGFVVSDVASDKVFSFLSISSDSVFDISTSVDRVFNTAVAGEVFDGVFVDINPCFELDSFDEDAVQVGLGDEEFLYLRVFVEGDI